MNVKLDIQAAVATLSIDAPEVLNALSTGLLQDLDSALAELENEQTVRILFVTGIGKAFVAGANIKEMRELDSHQAEDFGRLGHRVFARLAALPYPVVALVNGYALGGGTELALACDLRFASNKAKFGQPEVGLGITPGFGGTLRLAKLVGPSKAKELIFSGRVIDAEEAQRIGLVDKIVPAEELIQTGLDWAQMILKNSSNAIKEAKQTIDEALTLADSDVEIKRFAACFDHPHQQEGMSAFLEKRPAQFKEEK